MSIIRALYRYVPGQRVPIEVSEAIRARHWIVRCGGFRLVMDFDDAPDGRSRETTYLLNGDGQWWMHEVIH